MPIKDIFKEVHSTFNAKKSYTTLQETGSKKNEKSSHPTNSYGSFKTLVGKSKFYGKEISSGELVDDDSSNESVSVDNTPFTLERFPKMKHI